MALGLLGNTDDRIFSYINEFQARENEVDHTSFSGMTSLEGWSEALPVIMA